MEPEYSLPLSLIGSLATSAVFGARRSFRHDARALCRGIRPAPVVLGTEHIPGEGACLLTANHYARPGFGAWWAAAALSACLPDEAHWLMTAGWNCEGRRGAALWRPLSRWVLRRVAGAYGFTLMPPMPPDPREAGERALAVRRLVAAVRQGEAAWVGMMPEGRDIPGGRLGDPPPGAGRLMLHLAGLGLRILPAGVWEQDGALYLRFGPAYTLEPRPGLSSSEGDRCTAAEVMARIAALLPPYFAAGAAR